MTTSYKKETSRAKRYREQSLRGERNSSTRSKNTPIRTPEARKTIAETRFGRGKVKILRDRIREELRICNQAVSAGYEPDEVDMRFA